MARDEDFLASVSTYDSLLDKGRILTEFIDEWLEKVFFSVERETIIEFKGPKLRPRKMKFNSSDWAKVKYTI
jgi:hypothetical protein